MDERSVEAGIAYEQRLVARGLANNSRTRQFYVLVLGRNGDKPFDLEANNRQDCCDKLVDQGVDLIKDVYAAGHIIPSSGEPMVFGNNARAEQRLEDYLRKR